MDIGIYQYSLYNRGGDRLIVAYANHLAASGHTVTLYTRIINTMFSLSPAVRIQRVPCPGRVGFLFYGATHYLGHDVIIVNIIHLPFVLSLRNTVVYYAQADDREYYENDIMRKVMDMLYAHYFRGGKPIISMSRHLTDIFEQRYALQNAYTIETGIDHAMFYPDEDRDLVHQKGSRKAVVFMARGDAYRKGNDIALKVFKSLDHHVAKNMELWVCGNRSDQTLFGFPVRNFGIVTDSRLRQILSSADIFFYPSRHEGFGLFPLEAMACGTAVVTTEAIPYARSTSAMLTSPIGDVADLTNNVKRLILDDSLLSRLKNQGIIEARPYDLEQSKLAFETALTNIVTGKTV